jgi:hypothetical protein
MARRRNNQQAQDLPILMPDNQRDPISLAKLIDLRNRKLTYKQIAKLCDCSLQSVWERLQAFKESLETVDDYKRRRADVYTVVESALVNSLSGKDIKTASLATKVQAIDTIYKIGRLEEGKATAHVAYVDMTRSLDSLDQEDQALADELGIDAIDIIDDTDSEQAYIAAPDATDFGAPNAGGVGEKKRK